MKNFDLKNNLHAIYQDSPNTPRIALTLNIAINTPEKKAGINSLITRLLTQGTKNLSAEQIANELDENAIEFYSDNKQDYFRFRMICLNEDFDKSLSLFSDMILNSTFADFDKEKTKMHAEITADLDSARLQAQDNYIKTLFEGHYYGNTLTKILATIDDITKDDVVSAYQEILKTGEKFLSIVGDVPYETVVSTVEKYFNGLPVCNETRTHLQIPELKEFKRSDLVKGDIQQSQIYQGWLVPTYGSEDYAPLVVFNNILGSSGLSSRLFVNLRDKRGLAYTVRSLYETYMTCASFSIYIATEPSNIQISLDGFKEELQKLKDEQVSDTELANAKNNIIGKQQFVTETNMQRSNQLAYYGTFHLGYDYQQKYIDEIRKVTKEDVQKVANKYFGDISVVAVLRP